MTRTMGLPLLLALALVTVAPWTPAPDLEAVEWHMDYPLAEGSIRCEFDCEDGEGGTLFCAEPTFAGCCGVIGRFCADNGGVGFAGCYDDTIGVLCEF